MPRGSERTRTRPSRCKERNTKVRVGSNARRRHGETWHSETRLLCTWISRWTMKHLPPLRAGDARAEKRVRGREERTRHEVRGQMSCIRQQFRDCLHNRIVVVNHKNKIRPPKHNAIYVTCRYCARYPLVTGIEHTPRAQTDSFLRPDVGNKKISNIIKRN